MPGAQAEEPAAKEERSEPVQVGGGAFLGKDDLEDVSDEEIDWSNDEENIMIVEESIDEELSGGKGASPNCETPCRVGYLVALVHNHPWQGSPFL